jgi:hypothetical protein
MPLCPQCQTPYESEARFCQQCGASLSETETAPSGEQPETGETPAVPPAPDAPQPPARGLNPGLLAFLGGTGVIIIIAVVFLLTRPGAPPPAPEPASQAQMAEAVAPEADLQQQLGQLLSDLREAQINKDITRFMACYATTFPGRERKQQEALKAWQQFDFTAMFFYLENLKPEGPEAARAQVTWDLQVQDKRTQEFLTASQTFRVEFVKEQGAWRIRSLEEISAP